MNKHLGLAVIVLCLAYVLTQEEELEEEDDEEDEEEDEGWRRPTVVRGLLIHIQNVARNCSLTMLDQRYPPVYPDGRGSSHQLVVGCVPTGEDELNNPQYLWQIQHSQTDVHYEYDPDSLEVLTNGSRFSLKHWEEKRKLVSQNVASPTSVRKYEVSGLINMRKLSKQEISSQVKLI